MCRATILQVVAVAFVLAAPTIRAHDKSTAAARSASPPDLAAAPFLGVVRQAPDFILLDRRGQPVQLSQLQGRTVLLSFIFTQCASACPLLTQRMQLLQDRLARAGYFPARVALLSVTVDPQRDSAEVLERYAQRFDARRGWYFLREEPERLQPMLAAYKEWTKKLADGDVDHPARVYLIDPAGHVREIYSLAFFDERQALLDIKAVEREYRTPSQH